MSKISIELNQKVVKDAIFYYAIEHRLITQDDFDDIELKVNDGKVKAYIKEKGSDK